MDEFMNAFGLVLPAAAVLVFGSSAVNALTSGKLWVVLHVSERFWLKTTTAIYTANAIPPDERRSPGG